MSSPSSSLTRSQKSSILFKSNLPKSLRTSHPAGIVHAKRISTVANNGYSESREEHAFAWIQNLNATSEKLTLDHLAKYGFDHELHFIPYSTKAAWCTKYPNAVPYVECVNVTNMAEGGGATVSTVVRGYPLWSPNVHSVTDIPREVVEAAVYHGAASTANDNFELSVAMMGDGGTQKRPRDEPKFITKGVLNNAQRAELHSEIYNYFVWLRAQVKAEGGSKRKSVGGMSADGLKELLKSMDGALSSAKRSDGGGGDQTPPFLEESLFAKLKHRIDSGSGSTSAAGAAKRPKKNIGVRKEKGPSVSWEERLKQLSEFGQEHGHYDVPPPLDDNYDDNDVRFYNWVQKINYELRAYNNGNPTKLTKERADQLAEINFEANDAKPRGRPRIQQIIPEISWKKRMQQVQSYKDDVGHLNIDHQYKHCDNLGGWAVDMSTKHRHWKEGKLAVSSEMEAQFEELKALGFNFDVRSCYETTRTWDGHYEMLVEYKNKHGNARVPLKWKADLRLGKWVQLQRKAKRTKKLSEDHREKLEKIGFEWEVPKDQEHEQHKIVTQVRV